MRTNSQHQEVTCDKCMLLVFITLYTIFWPLANWSCTVGKTLAFTNITFTNPNGHVVARGSHTKFVLSIVFYLQPLMLSRYVTLAWKDPNNIVEEMNKLKDLK